MRLSMEIPVVQAWGYPRVHYCTPAIQAAPLKEWRAREARETTPAGTFKDVGEQKKIMEAQQNPTVVTGPSVAGACISVYDL